VFNQNVHLLGDNNLKIRLEIEDEIKTKQGFYLGRDRQSWFDTLESEYNRLMKYGKFSNNALDKPWVMDTKWFATNQTNADKWGKKLNPNGYKIVEVTVPRKALSGMYYNGYLDSIGPAYNATVPYINSVMIGLRTVK